jgi:hypothetical protein
MKLNLHFIFANWGHRWGGLFACLPGGTLRCWKQALGLHLHKPSELLTVHACGRHLGFNHISYIQAKIPLGK